MICLQNYKMLSSNSSNSYVKNKKKRQEKMKQVKKKFQEKLVENGYSWDEHVVPLNLTIDWLVEANQNPDDYYTKLVDKIIENQVNFYDEKISSIEKALEDSKDVVSENQQELLVPFMKQIQEQLTNLKINKKILLNDFKEAVESEQNSVKYIRYVDINNESFVIFQKKFISDKGFNQWKKMNNKTKNPHVDVNITKD